MKRSTNKLILAATTASPNKMNTKLRATYPGMFVNAWSFWNNIIIFRLFSINKYLRGTLVLNTCVYWWLKSLIFYNIFQSSQKRFQILFFLIKWVICPYYFIDYSGVVLCNNKRNHYLLYRCLISSVNPGYIAERICLWIILHRHFNQTPFCLHTSEYIYKRMR